MLLGHLILITVWQSGRLSWLLDEGLLGLRAPCSLMIVDCSGLSAVIFIWSRSISSAGLLNNGGYF